MVSDLPDNAIATDAGANVDLNVSRVVKILLALRDWDQRDFAAAMQMDPATVTRLMKGQRIWKLTELKRLSLLFEKPMAYFLEEPEALVRSRCSLFGDLEPLPEVA